MNDFQQQSTALSRVLTVILIFFATTLQTTLLRGLEVFHVIPNLLLIIVVCYSLQHDDYSSLAVGVICGLLLDITGGKAVGINTLLCTYAAFFCLSISGSLFNNNVFVSMVFVMLLTIPYELLTYLFYFVIWGKSAWLYAIFCKILPAAVYNLLFTLVAYPVVRHMTAYR